MDTAQWFYNTIRGIDKSEINPRVLIKSMLSAKSFRPVIKTHEDAIAWLRIFVADIHGRLQEEGCLQPGGRRPKTMTLGHRGLDGSQKHRQCAIPSGRDLDEEQLLNLATRILRQTEAESKAYPCAGLQLQISGFEERAGPGSTGGILGFLVKPGATRTLHDPEQEDGDERSRKRPKIEENDGLCEEDKTDTSDTMIPIPTEYDDRREFVESTIEKADNGAIPSLGFPAVKWKEDGGKVNPQRSGQSVRPTGGQSVRPTGGYAWPSMSRRDEARDLNKTYICDECSATILLEACGEHQDWHFAKSLAAEERSHGESRQHSSGIFKAPSRSKKRGMPSQNTSTSKTLEKGQKRLNFG